MHEAFNKGLKSKFQQQSQYKINYSYEYFDMARFENNENYLADTARYFQSKYAKRSPDMVVTSSRLAPFLLKYGHTIFPAVPVLMVWEGYNLPTANNIPANCVVFPGGYDAQEQVDKNIQLIMQTRPFTQKVLIVVGDSEEERGIINRTLPLNDKYANQVELVFLNRLPFAEMLERIRNANDNSVILFLRWFVDAEGKNFIPAGVLQTIYREAKAPIYGVGAHLLGAGPLGGYSYNFEISGQNVAEAGLDILRGKKPSEILVSGMSASEYAFDWRELKRWGIDEAKLPPGSRIEHKEYSVWEIYKSYIISGIVLLLLETTLVLGLLINRIKRKRAESELIQLNMSLESKIFERTQELEEANQELIIAKEQQEALNKQLYLTSRTDSLTGLYNRRYMEEKLQEEYEKYLRTGTEFSVVILDIDFFKKVNDMYGHDAGDCLLKLIAADLRGSVRAYETAARWGGEEFLLLLPAASTANAETLAERIRRRVEEQTYSYGSYILSATLTLGVAAIRSNDTITDLIKRADNALYQGKRSGRNRVITDNSQTKF